MAPALSMSTPEQLRPEDETIPRPSRPRKPRGKGVPDARQFPGSEFLVGDCAKTVLARLNQGDGDPLEIAEHCRERIAHHAILVSEPRLYLRSIARIAYASMKYAGEPELSAWLNDRIDQGLAELLIEDREAERLGSNGQLDPEQRYTFLTEVLGVDPHVAREAAVVFNDLPDDVRHAFWALVVEGKSLNRHVAEGHGPLTGARARVKRAIIAISTLNDPGDEQQLGKEPS